MIRLSASDNPLGLHIGEVITVRRVCTIAYDENEKRLFFEDYYRAVIIIGSVKRALGTYVSGRTYGLIAQDADPPRLKVTKYVRLYECRTAFSGKPFLIHPDDIVSPK